MEVVLETSAGKRYPLEMGFFDTVLELKEKLQRYHNIPISKQTLFFNGTLMEDHKYADEFQLIDGSRVDLSLSPPSPAPPADDDFHDQGLSWFETASPSAAGLPDQFEALPPNFDASQEATVCHFSGRPPTSEPPSSPSEEESQSEKKVRRMRRRRKRAMTLHVTVFEKEGKVQVEVLPGTKASELRKWLEMNAASVGLQLPDGGYFFIHRQKVMEEGCSFRSHGFQDGDMVEVFPGTVGGEV